jgi:hypothetical protein
MPLTHKWLEDFLCSKFHHDARAYNLMAEAITGGGEEGARAALVYAREAYGAQIASVPFLTKERCPELLELDRENIK